MDGWYFEKCGEMECGTRKVNYFITETKISAKKIDILGQKVILKHRHFRSKSDL